jgi:ABC-type glycerol-3-phosphate transport system substrate-binding protein
MGKVGVGVAAVVVAGAAYYAGTATAPVAAPSTVTKSTTVTSTATTTVTSAVTPTTTAPGLTGEALVRELESAGLTIPKEPIVLQCCTVGGSRFEFPMRELLPGIKAKYPWVKDIEFAVAEWEGTQARVAAELSARSGAFDIVHGGWESATPYFEAELLEPVDDWITNPSPEVGIHDYRTDYPSNIQELYTHKGKTWELAFDINCMVTYYRKDVFDELGLTAPAAFATWDDTIATAKKLKENGYMTGRCMMRGTKVYEHYLTILWSLGGSTYDETTMEPTINTEVGLKALEIDMELQEYAAPGSENWGDSEIADAFQTGMVHFAPGEWGGAASISPYENPTYADVMMLGPVPGGPGGPTWQCPKAGSGCFMGGAGYGIPIDSKYKDAAWLVIRYLNDLKPYPDDKTDRYLSKGAQPGRMSVLNDPGWQNKYKLLSGLSYCLPVACFKFGKLPEHPDMTMAFGTELHEAIFGGKDKKQALADAEAAWRDIFVKAGYLS